MDVDDIAISAVSRQDKADMLTSGLIFNREIGKAVGLLMALHKVSDVVAFDLLHQASMDMDLKISDIARELVNHHNSSASSSDESVAQ